MGHKSHLIKSNIDNLMKRRIFIALGISKELIGSILNWEENFAHKSKDTHSKIRWLKPNNLHITLVPPWYEDDSGIKKVEDLLDLVGRKKFTLEFYRINYGPNPKKQRLVWLEGEAPHRLIDFRDDLYVTLGKEREKGFMLHLTIGRFRENEFSSFLVKEINDEFIFKEEVSSLLLMESHLGKSGAEYEVLYKIDFHNTA